jgi:hypothetical protein
MTVYQIACDNCGAKYKLPETFTGKQAKCQKCGSVIEVQKQREAASAAAAAPAAKPAAAARPAVDRSKPAAADAAKPAAARSARAGKADDADGGGKKGRGEREKKKDNTMPILLAGVGLLVIAGGAFFVLGGGEKPADAAQATTPQQQAKAEPPKADAPKAEAPPAAAPQGDAPKADAPKAEAPAATPPTAEPAKAEPTAPAAAPAEPATPDDPTRPKKPWERMRNAPASMADVADPKGYGEVPWPPGVDDVAKGKLRELAADAAGDGIRSTRAKNELQKTGWAAIFALVEQLQKLDYKQPEQAMVGFDLNKLLEAITGGVNLRYEPVDAGESIPAAKAEWNTRTVKGWIEFAGRSVDQEAYDKARAERLKKAGGADK